MNDILWSITGIITFVSWYLYVFETLPKIRKHRNVYLRDWGFSVFQPARNLTEYKKICEEENQSLIWYKAQIYLVFAFIGVGLISIFII